MAIDAHGLGWCVGGPIRSASEVKVLIYTLEFLPFSGGIATFCNETAAGLQSIGHDVVVIAPAAPGSKELGKLPFRVDWVAAMGPKWIVMARGKRRMVRVMREWQPDVVIVTQSHALVSAAFARTSVWSRIVPVVHGSEILRHSSRRTVLDRLLARRMGRFFCTRDLVVCVSGYVRELLLRKFAVSPSRAVVVHNGLKNRFDIAKHSGGQVRKRWNISSRAIVLLTLARLTPRKGQDVMIRAMRLILDEVPDVVYVCAGTGAYLEYLTKLAHRLAVANNVILTGEVPESEKYSYYDACDLYVMLSRRDGNNIEGFGLSFLEAWHARKPVVGGCHGGVTEVIDDGVNGHLVDPESVADVADRIVAAVRDRARLCEMGQRGLEKSRERFSESAMAVALSSALERRCS